MMADGAARMHRWPVPAVYGRMYDPRDGQIPWMHRQSGSEGVISGFADLNPNLRVLAKYLSVACARRAENKRETSYTLVKSRTRT